MTTIQRTIRATQHTTHNTHITNTKQTDVYHITQRADHGTHTAYHNIQHT